MLPSLAATILGSLVFLFIFWKRLKEDYAAEIIFSVSAYILLGILVGWFLSSRFLPSWFLWSAFAGALGGLALGIMRFKMRFYEILEAFTISLLPWVSFDFLKDSVINSSLSSFIGFLAFLIIIFIFYYLDAHFREFTWYKSGKVGFAGLTTLAIIFTARLAIAILGVPVLSFSGKFEAIVSGAMAFICLGLVHNLSRKIE